MRVVNVSESTVLLDDINVVVTYNRRGESFDIPDHLARKSHNLRFALKEEMLIDVTAGMPAVMPKFTPKQIEPDPESPYFKKQAILSRDDKIPAPDKISPAPIYAPGEKGPTAYQIYKDTGEINLIYGGPACFPPEAKVLTSNGIKQIKDVAVGDMVFTHKGRLRKVITKFERPYEGEVISIRSSLDTEEMVLTPNHQVFTVAGAECVLRKKQTCKPTCQTQHNIVKYMTNKGERQCFACVQRPYKNYEIEKIAAENLTERNFLVAPVLTEEATLDSICIKNWQGDYEKFSSNEEWIWPTPKPQSNCFTTLVRKYDLQNKILENNNKEIREILEKEPEYDEEARQGKRIPLNYKLDFDFGRFLGLYIAEGHSTESTVLSLHEDEIVQIDFLQSFIKNRLGLESAVTQESNGKKGKKVTFHSIIFANFLREACGVDCYTKIIPSFVWNSPTGFIDGFLRGYWEGDGKKTARSKDNSLRFLGSASASLAYGFRLLLSKFGVIGGIAVEKHSKLTFGKKTYYYDPPLIGYVINISGKQLYDNEWLKTIPYNTRPHKLKQSSRDRQHYKDDEYAYTKITTIKKEPYNGKVYNIEVEEDHSYLVAGKAVKNCDYGGYARMNRQFLFGLSEQGVNVKFDNTPSMGDVDAIIQKKLNALTAVRVPRETPKMYGMTAPGHPDWDKYKMYFTMMETRRLHKDYVSRCNCADEIIVPSHWCKEVFTESGVKKPISVVPLGVDLNIYKPNVEPIGFSKNLKPFIFLSVFGWSLRKGYDVLLKAYLEEFTSDDPVTLLISSRYFGSTDETKKQVIRNDIAKISSMVANTKKPQVVLFGDGLSDELMPRLYAAADCFVLISRGEGFGLPAIEAGACDIPVITSRYSGHTDFCNDENSYLVDVDGFRSAEMSLAWISYFYEDAEFPIFGEKAVEQTRYYMRRVFENKEEREEKSNKLHKRVTQDYGWPVCVNKMHEKLKDTFEKYPQERK